MTLTSAARPLGARSATARTAGSLTLGLALASALTAVAGSPAAADTTGGYEMCPTVYYYVVPEGSPGLEAIADLILDDPERADEIYGYNEGRSQSDGTALGEDRAVQPGWRLVVPFDSGGEGVYEGRDPLCVVAVDQANAQGVAPPSPPPAPPAYTPPPENEPSASPSEDADASAGPGDRPKIDPRILIVGAVVLILLTLLTLFWQPVFKAIAWPFKKIAALPWRKPRKPRSARIAAAMRRRRAATESVISDPDAVHRAGGAHTDLLSAPAEIPARPVAILTTLDETTAIVPVGATPPPPHGASSAPPPGVTPEARRRPARSTSPPPRTPSCGR
ncbi:hypothetical protein [Nocardiopsis alba]|uniref:hypothetical protein n=1 Tax=Nocardiopsis alba TaxID=53437 RepID=UPI001F2D078E|nr:hypothetical protein [Nocardiopsis alba]